MNSHLILITNSFPYGIREVFLENEITYLSTKFDKISILAINLDEKPTSQRNIPNNCKTDYLILKKSKINKLLSIKLLSKALWSEFLYLLNNKLINTKTISTLLVSLSNAKRIKNEINKKIKKSDKNYLYSYWGNDGAIALGLVNKGNIIKFCRVHRYDLYFYTNSLNYLPFRSTLFNNLNAIFSISDDGKNYIEKYWNTKTTVIVSRLGVKKPIRNNNIYLNKQDKFKLNSESIFKLVSCSNLIPVKRVDIIIEALSLIKKHSILWIHFGDGKEFEILNKLAKDKLSSNIKIQWKGRLENKEILNQYKIINPDLFINLSKSEGIPVSIMEAMSFGIPCLATNVGGTKEIVTNKNGFLIDIDTDIKIISDKIIQFIKLNEIEKLSFKKNALETWRNKYNEEENYKRFVKKIKEL